MELEQGTGHREAVPVPHWGPRALAKHQAAQSSSSATQTGPPASAHRSPQRLWESTRQAQGHVGSTRAGLTRHTHSAWVTWPRGKEKGQLPGFNF